MHRAAALFALIAGVSAAVAHLTDDWADWECPGFPCYIVNYFEYQPHGKLSQTCGGSDLPMEDCNILGRRLVERHGSRFA